MHLGALALGLSLSLVRRVENGRVVNRWGPFMNLYSPVKKLAKFIYDGKNRGHRADYERLLANANKECRVINIPNKTRVGGVQLLMKDMLRNMSALRYYASEESKCEEIMLSLSQWKQLAQFASIMLPAFDLCMTSQNDRVETAGEMPIILAMLMANYKYNSTYNVVNTTEKWGAETLFKNLPTVKMATNQDTADRLQIE